MLITIIIPCFNASGTLSRCLGSLLEEITDDIEVLLIDDCSSDSTYKDILIYQETKPISIKVFRNKINRGVSYTRNKGIELATGKYILFLDSDDYYSSGFITSLFSKIKKNPEVDMISFSFIRKGVNEGLDKSYSKPKFNNVAFTSDEFLKRFTLKEINQHICSLVIKSDVLKRNSIFFDMETKLGEDVEFQIKIILSSNCIVYYSDDSFVYEYNSISVTNSPYDEKHTTLGAIYFRVKEFLLVNNKSELLPHVNFYYSYTYIFLLTRFLSTGNPDLMAKILRYDEVLNEKSFLSPFNSKSILVFFSKVIYKIKPELFLFLLKKVFR